jgi:hypothetical protein
MGIHCSLSMLGSAVSSSTPKDFQPSSHMGVRSSRPVMNRHAWPAPPGRACVAVGMQRALDSAIGLPNRSTKASRMLAFLMPADVRRNLILPPGVITADENFLGAYGCLRGRDWQTAQNSSALARSSLTSSRDIPERWRSRRAHGPVYSSAHQSRRPSTSSRRASPRLGAPMTRISRPFGPAS